VWIFMRARRPSAGATQLTATFTRRPSIIRGDDVRTFCAWFAAPAVVGLESSGYALWFHQLLDELGHEVRVSEDFAIRQLARRRQKNDRRDAELLWELLLRGDFSAGHVPCPPSREVLALLRCRHRLIRIRTMAKNGL
jgi:transposase